MEVRTEPRLGFTALIKFMPASDVRRQSILRKQKYPEDGPMRSYVAAESHIRASLLAGTPPRPTPDMRDYEEEAVQAYAAMAQDWGDFVVTRPDPSQTKLEVEGVEISVYPTLLVEDAKGRKGAIKLYFNKEPELTEEIGQKMATLLRVYGDRFEGQGAYHPSLCQVVEVRRGVVHTASKHHKKLLKDIEAACVFVKAVWPVI